MGTIRQGALGGFSGKAGSIIGSSWRDPGSIGFESIMARLPVT